MRTKTLLLGGAVAGPLFIMVGLGQALLRDGFDLGHNTLSLLSNGAFGWVQVLNFSLSGALYLGGAIGAGRALRQPGPGGTWGPRLLACFGLCMIGAGVFRPDPAFGFPPGTAAGPPTTTSWHGGLHYTFASLAFVALLGAFVALARRHARHGHRGWAAATWTIAAAMTAATVLISTAAELAPVNVFYVATTLLAFLWASVLLAQLLATGTRSTATVPQSVTWR
jgi:Protein of unknown function (DUF998)